MTAEHSLALLRFAAMVVGSTTIAVVWCRTFPVGYDRLIWRRLRERLNRPKLAAHDQLVCMNLHRLGERTDR